MTSKMTIGLSEDTCSTISNALNDVLANTYVLAVKTQGFHWNVVGAHFLDLHAMFGRQYDAMAATVDLVAERIRALDNSPVSSMKDMLSRSYITEESGPIGAAEAVKQLLVDHERCAASVRRLAKFTGKYEDQPTTNMLADIGQFHEKEAWMLRSLLA